MQPWRYHHMTFLSLQISRASPIWANIVTDWAPYYAPADAQIVLTTCPEYIWILWILTSDKAFDEVFFSWIPIVIQVEMHGYLRINSTCIGIYNQGSQNRDPDRRIVRLCDTNTHRRARSRTESVLCRRDRDRRGKTHKRWNRSIFAISLFCQKTGFAGRVRSPFGLKRPDSEKRE
jgi:hypothetical protein